MTIEQYLENPPVWLIVGFFVFVWWFALTMIARMSGWTELADYYGDKDRLEGPRLRFQSMSMGRGGFNQANFGGVITLTATPFALEIATFPPFNVTMKPLLIPMTDLSASVRKENVRHSFGRSQGRARGRDRDQDLGPANRVDRRTVRRSPSRRCNISTGCRRRRTALALLVRWLFPVAFVSEFETLAHFRHSRGGVS